MWSQNLEIMRTDKIWIDKLAKTMLLTLNNDKCKYIFILKKKWFSLALYLCLLCIQIYILIWCVGASVWMIYQTKNNSNNIAWKYIILQRKKNHNKSGFWCSNGLSFYAYILNKNLIQLNGRTFEAILKLINGHTHNHKNKSHLSKKKTKTKCVWMRKALTRLCKKENVYLMYGPQHLVWETVVFDVYFCFLFNLLPSY